MSGPGQQIGRYRVLSVLDETSDDWRVYLAQRDDAERLFAVKVFRASLSAQQVERCQRGAHLAAKVNHPNLVRPIEVGQTAQGALFVASEHVPGETLRAALEHRKRFHWREAANLVADAGEGVDAAHRAGLIHGDLGAETIVLNRKSGRAMVLDFGLARDTLAEGRLTATGEVLGNLVYMSPEQLNGKPAESPADVYALAALLYELISGELPYLGRDLEDLRQKIASGKRLDLRKRVPEVPRDLMELLDRAMSTDPRRRPPVRVFAQSLRDLGSVETAIPTSIMHAKRRGISPALVAGSFALWFLVVGGLFAWAISLRSTTRAAESRASELEIQVVNLEQQATQGHEERAEVLGQLNRTSSALTQAQEEARRSRLEASELGLRVQRLEQGETSETSEAGEIERLKRDLDEATQALARRSKSQAGDASFKVQASSIRALLDWICLELKGVPGGRLLRATILHNRGRYEDALEALEGEGLSAPLATLRARVLYKLARMEEAQAAFKAVATKEPNSPHGLFSRALLEVDRAKQLGLARQAVQEGPNLVCARILLSDLLTASGLRQRSPALLEESFLVIESAVELDPSSPQIYESRAQLFSAKAKLEGKRAPLKHALGEVQTGLLLNPAAGLRLRAAEILRALGRSEEALEQLRLGLGEADLSGRPQARIHLRLAYGSNLVGSERHAEGIRLLREALTVESGFPAKVREAFMELPEKLRREVLAGLSQDVRARFSR